MAVEAKDRIPRPEITEVNSSSPDFLISGLLTLPEELHPSSFGISFSAMDENRNFSPRPIFGKDHERQILMRSRLLMVPGRRYPFPGFVYENFTKDNGVGRLPNPSEVALAQALISGLRPHEVVYTGSDKKSFETYIEADFKPMAERSPLNEFNHYILDSDFYHLHDATLKLNEDGSNSIYLKHDAEKRASWSVQVALSKPLAESDSAALHQWLSNLAKIKTA